MIPIKLTLRNFMCYHDDVPSLSFDSFHVACLCGDNGSGKSALLDAITWALWGKTRAKNDNDLIYMGEGVMEVEFEFAVGENRYRILRKRTKPGLRRTGQSLLELQSLAPGGFVSISGNTMRETEQKIIEVLHMDYQTFINSALLLQGRANEFSMKTPGERKEVLANILGLSLYDQLEERAKNRSREQEIQQRQLNSDIVRIEQQLEHRGEYESELRRIQDALAGLAGEIEKQESALAVLRERREALRFKEEQYKEIDRKAVQNNQQLKYLTDQARQHSAMIEEYDKVLSAYQDEYDRLQSKLAELGKMEQGLTGKRECVEELSSRIHYFKSMNAQLNEEMKGLKSKMNLLDHGNAECPLCGSELGAESLERISVNYAAQGHEKGDAYRVNEGEIRDKEGELNVLRQEIGRLEYSIGSDRGQWERRAETLESRHTEAEKSLPECLEALSQAKKVVDGLCLALEEDASKRKDLEAEIKALPVVSEELGRVERDYKSLREQERNHRDKLVEIQAGLQRLVQMEVEKGEKTGALRQAVEEKAIYDELAVAFGKKGVQALIIEQALPEIEEEANLLLGRMTENRMHLKIESQRDTKKGDTIETMEIKISDELGTRNYEMFSGGEAFRIDFALRIALSRLLTRRVGAPLSTLIIDEGFGTQDSSGKDKLVEVINSIQDDFEKLLVITHIEELKDAFPVRIEVTKTEEGSTLSVI
ncbi:AAA family ATPase [Chloroflexota bacterium]